jgi:segregation and condensation protein B
VSRKRKQQPVAEVSIGVPEEEILAEGSGPHEDPASEAERAPAIELVAELVAIEVDELPPEKMLADEVPAEEMLGDEMVDDEPGADGELAADAEIGAAAMPTSAASMDAVQLKQLIEALVFASDRPITVLRLRQLTRVSDIKRLEQTLAEITSDYEHRGLVLQQVSGGYQFRTRPQFSAWVQQLIQGRPVRLSRAQLETLAIIAYRQPITRPEIDDIRGVDSSATLKLLMDRALIRMLGKKEEVGRPILYGTTKEFLDFFSLGDLRELPTLREYSELSDESRKVMSSRLGIGLEGGGEGGSGSGSGDGGVGGAGGGAPDDGGFGGDSGGPLDGGEIADASALSETASELLADSAAEGDELASEELAADAMAADELVATDDVMAADDLMAEPMLAGEAVPSERFAEGTTEIEAQGEPFDLPREAYAAAPEEASDAIGGAMHVDAMSEAMNDDAPAQLGDPPDPAQD